MGYITFDMGNGVKLTNETSNDPNDWIMWVVILVFFAIIFAFMFSC